MKRTSKLILTLAMSAVMALGVVGFAACQGADGENGKSAYEIAVENGFKGTEQEWLESLKGADGKDGVDGTNGTDGKDGVDGTNGTDGKDGVDGTNGTDGKNGNGWHYGKGEPSAEVGTVGDLYLDLESGDVWTKEEGGWVKSELNIKGGNGEEPGGEEDNVVKDFGQMDIAAGKSVELSFDDVENGTYYLVANTSVEAAKGNLAITGSDNSNNFYYDMYSTLNSGYTCVIIVRDSISSIKLNNVSNLNMSLTLKLVDFVPPTIVDGEEVEVPARNLRVAEDYIAIPIDPALAGKKVKITCSAPSITLWDDTEAHAKICEFTAFDKKDGLYVKEVTLSAELTNICFTCNSSTKWEGSTTQTHQNIRIKIEIV